MSRSARAGASSQAHVSLGPLWLGWVVFVVYGSLVPLNFHPLPWADALRQLLQAPMLDLGVQQRADWVANGVLYMPVGFLGAAVLMGPLPGPGRKLLACGAALLLGTLLALGVELAQTAFPGRTVSRNDLLAEALGTAAGAAMAWAGTRPVRALLAGLQAGGPALWRVLGPAYALVYVGQALFPFDLLLSPQELATKLHSPYVAAWLAAADTGQSAWRQGAKALVETLAAVPLGLYWAVQRQSVRHPQAATTMAMATATPERWLPSALAGLLLGLAIEGAQLLLASGVSQGASVLTRMVGFTLGAALSAGRVWPHAEAVRAAIRRASGPGLAVYVALLALQAGWLLAPWLPVEQAWGRLLHEVRFVPLYYHYYSSEAHAVASLMAVGGSYAPVGLLAWAWHLHPGTAAWCAAGLAGLNEAGRLMASTTRPDPSNLLIAAAAAWAVHRLAQMATARAT